jgi:hypothetical protein
MFDDEGYAWGVPEPNSHDPVKFWKLMASHFNDEMDGPHDFEDFQRFFLNMMKIDPEEKMSADCWKSLGLKMLN